jgi:60 kDa SS-A/Ro ribonucleoprotein
MTELISERLRNKEDVRKAGGIPYQLMVAYVKAEASVPPEVKEALQDAMEIATENTPALKGKVYICPDVSGSMDSPVTGFRKGATTAVRCIDAAALFTASLMRRNPEARVLPFADRLVNVALNARDTILTNAARLAAVGGGGTKCSAPLRFLNRSRAEGDMVILISDNQSWVDDRQAGATALMREWSVFRKRNPGAKLVCLDLQPHGTLQAVEREDILNAGGFSDQVFTLVAAFAEGKLKTDHWVGEIEAVSLAE